MRRSFMVPPRLTGEGVRLLSSGPSRIQVRLFTAAFAVCGGLVIGLAGGLFSDMPVGVLAVVSSVGLLLLTLKPVWALCLFALLAPLRGVFVRGDVLSLAKVMGVVVVMGWSLRLLVGRRRLFITASHAVGFVLLALAAASLLWSGHMGDSAIELASLVGLMGIFFVVPQLIESWEAFTWLIRSALVGQVLLALIAVYYAVTGVSYAPGSGWLPWIGTNRAYVGHTLYLAIFFALIEFARPRRGKADMGILPRGAALPIILLCVFAALSTGSRIFLVVFLVGLLTLFVRLARNWGRRSLLRVVVPLVILVVLGGAFITPLAYQKLQSTVQNPAGALAADTRTDIWAAYREVLRDFPMLGVGIGESSKVYIEYAPRIRSDPRFVFGAQGTGVSTHSLYLSFLVELGVVGFSLAVVFLVSLWMDLRRALKKQAEPFRRGVGIAIGLTYFALLLAGIGESLADKDFLWLGLSLIPAYVRLVAAPQDSEERASAAKAMPSRP